MKRVWHRLYSDFLMPSRLEEYRSLLKLALRRGYTLFSIASFWQLIQAGRPLPDRSLILRHDVDTDIRTARRQFEIEQSLGVPASYYFRLSTVDYELMRAIDRAGGEASYHFEELAAVAKQKGLRSRAQVVAHLDEIRRLFARNLTALRRETGLPMTIVASHGDFANRFLDMANWELLNDQLRAELGIALEVYDDAINRHVTSRHADARYPAIWEPGPPEPALERGEPVLYLLTHPRQWQASPLVNLQDDLWRVWEGIHYHMRWR